MPAEDPAANSLAIAEELEQVAIRAEDVARRARTIFERMRAPRQPQEAQPR